MKSILFVDDEARILKALSRVFSDSGLEILCAETAEQALATLEGRSVSLVVSDMRMPGMNGIELLRTIKEKYPATLRIILSGYSDEGVILDALTHNVAMAYLYKPWDNGALVRTVNQVFDTEALLMSGNLLAAINGMDALPTLKPYYQEILASVESDADITDIASRIERDHSVSSRILHIANSAFYGVSTGSVGMAVSFLGLRSTRDLVLATAVIDLAKDGGECARAAEAVWKHSLLANRILQLAIELFAPQKYRDYGSSGLLHNIGTVFLIKQFGASYLELIAEARGNPTAVLTDLELARFGFTHSQAGGCLLKWWNLPYPVVEAALYHDNPLDGRVVNRELVCAVHIAQKYAGDIGGNRADCRFCPEAFEALGIERDALEKRLEEKCPLWHQGKYGG